MNPTISSKWYETFFESLAVEFWDQAIPEEITEQEIEFLSDVFGAPVESAAGKPQHLLDLLCGSGRHVPALSKQGYHITAIDSSSKMLEMAKTRYQQYPDAKFLQADMLNLKESLSGSESFDGAYCLGNSLGYVDAEKTKAFLSDVVALLNSGSYLILHSNLVQDEAVLLDGVDADPDSNVPKAASQKSKLGQWESKLDMVAGDIHAMVENVAYDAAQRVLSTRFVFELESEVADVDVDSSEADLDEDILVPSHKEEHLIQHHIFTTQEITQWLSALGCEPVAFYADTEKTPYQPGDEQWYGVFKKLYNC